ncbi:MAG: hypothetical protein ACHQEM_01350 [Chitinophagales bacterium]
MKRIIPILLTVNFLATMIHGQGCIAIRNLAGFGQFAQLGYGDSHDTWMFDISNRYFHSWNLYSGKEQIGADGVNLYEYSMNLNLSHYMKKGWSYSVDLPIAVNKATVGQGPYNAIHAVGIGDIRITGYKWILNTEKYQRGNIQVGLGVKLPTGNYHYEDYYYLDPNSASQKILAPVNVAIQLGDGGTGITTEINAYYLFSNKFSVNANLFYLISPRDVNGVASTPPEFLDDSTKALMSATTTDVNSVPDNYTLSAGGNYTFGKLVGSMNLRFEGAPAHDLFGDNDGLRRVGYIFSVQPGLQYKFSRSFLYVFTSFPVVRATIKTVPDERQEAITGKPFITPGHFANWLVYFGYAFTF